MTHPFDSRPDETLGHLLRTHLDAPDHAAFAAEIRARLAGEPPPTSWEVLAGWAAPGMVAAIALIVVLAFWLARPENIPVDTVALDTDSGVSALLVSDDDAPGPEVLLSLAREEP